MMLGLEVLHLIGNGIFLGTLGLLYFLTRNKWVRWGLYPGVGARPFGRISFPIRCS